jgi:serine/threonine protein phosphatase 1
MPDDMKNLTVFVSEWEAAPGRLAQDDVVCAVGDVHGYARHLATITNWAHESALADATKRRRLVFLGDYVDRGPQNLAVLQFLENLAPRDIEIIRLIGNHELFLIDFLGDPDFRFDRIESWVSNGGLHILAEFGIVHDDLFRNSIAELRMSATARLPPDAAQCLTRLAPSFSLGTYLFVHAGVDPAEPLDLTDLRKLTTIREPFLSGVGWPHPFAVVHGHTICAPEVEAHRVAVDAGVYRTGMLACAHFEADRVRFAIATDAEDLAEFEKKDRDGRLLRRRWTKA